MVVKKYNVERPEIQPEPAKVKMSGYLKKKRSVSMQCRLTILKAFQSESNYLFNLNFKLSWRRGMPMFRFCLNFGVKFDLCNLVI